MFPFKPPFLSFFLPKRVDLRHQLLPILMVLFSPELEHRASSRGEEEAGAHSGFCAGPSCQGTDGTRDFRHRQLMAPVNGQGLLLHKVNLKFKSMTIGLSLT